jgi:hypothetical protein
MLDEPAQVLALEEPRKVLALAKPRNMPEDGSAAE